MTETTEAVGGDGGRTVAASRAAVELELKRGEFDLAVQLGAVRTRARRDGGRPEVGREEIERLRSQEGFPGTLQARVRTVGTAEGAALLGISTVRFTRLARAGCVTPVAFCLNRYRAVVWLYLAQEVGALASRSPELLVGNSPPWMRERLAAGADCRPRNWRSRRVERLLELTEDPWARAAVVAQTLDPVQLAEVVDDPYERAYFNRVRPEPLLGGRGSIAGREARERLMLADEPDEILWRRISLVMELDNARELRPAPRPGDTRRPGPEGEGEGQGVPAEPADSVERAEPVGPGAPAEAGEPVGTGGPPGPVGAARPAGLLARLRLRGVRGGRRPRAAAVPGAPGPAGRRTRPSGHRTRPAGSRTLLRSWGSTGRGAAGDRS
ncbi:DUF6397 family protein [Streptomyces sp. ITFR-16]|uniref:DUF6397 family protein n=1 Tax=Streptomyces sp. ITFR-16 TaxID=3075198 RepID=UPI00288BA294|nr:DUF6397 family protein [Streptomyces sp. ITFR-16]WNI20638.1 DUF6397 family protein [Streptomyces sp. ITFR-16]